MTLIRIATNPITGHVLLTVHPPSSYQPLVRSLSTIDTFRRRVVVIRRDRSRQ